jgi:SHAQKYF class myb-like DNA-binding protein
VIEAVQEFQYLTQVTKVREEELTDAGLQKNINKFVEALKKFGKQWKKVEDYIQTRSGAQIRSHAQKYFLKIQKEYPDQDPYEIFKCNSPEFLEDTIFMKNKGDSDDVLSSNSQNVIPAISQTSGFHNEVLPKEQEHEEKEEVSDFAQAVQDMLSRKKTAAAIVERPHVPLYNSHYNDLVSIRSFFDHVKSILPSNDLPPLNQVVAGEGIAEQ